MARTIPTKTIPQRESFYQKKLEAMKAEARAQAQATLIEGAAGGNNRVSPLDPDFLLITFFAIALDGLDIVTEIFSIALYPKAVGIVLDVFTFFIIGGWIYARTKKIAQSKKQQVESITKQLEGRVSQMQKQLAKSAAKNPATKTLLREGITLLGEIIPFLGLLPFWTISVILVLREK